MANNTTLTSPAEVAEAFFDGSVADLHAPGKWEPGAYSIRNPWEVWCVDQNRQYAQKFGLSNFVGSIAYALVEAGIVPYETTTAQHVHAAVEELERIACIELHVEGKTAGLQEYKRVQSDRSRLREIEAGKEFIPISALVDYLGKFRKDSFSR